MKRNALMIGIFVLVGLALIVAAILTLGGTQLFTKQLNAVVYFEGSVRGLYVGAPVTFRGVKIGEVNGIGIDVDQQSLATRIPVGLTLGMRNMRMGPDGKPLRSIPELVKRGLRAKLILQSVVTGQTAIDLDFKPNSPLHLIGKNNHDTPEIPATQDRLDALLEQISNLPLADLAADLRETLQGLNQTLKAGQGAVAKASAQLGDAAVQAEKTLAVGADALKAVQQQSQTTLASIEKLSNSSNDLVKQAQPELVNALRSTRDAVVAAQEAMANLAELSAPGAPLRADLEMSVRDLSETTRSLRAFSEQLDHQPNSLIFGKKTSP